MEIDPLALNDFGFTTVDETELATFKKAITEIESKGEDIENLEDKLNELYKAIQPLLNNLKVNPTKEYILWPDRLEKVKQFEDYLKSIYES
jgi:hypothetical protein|tara:strand:+ start:682 stop:954 length:273 start_codon:yes stop_codon:yes gene_type:complete